MGPLNDVNKMYMIYCWLFINWEIKSFEGLEENVKRQLLFLIPRTPSRNN